MNYPNYDGHESIRAQDPLLRVLDEVGGERARQDAKWGQQNHQDGTGDDRHLFRTRSRETYGTLCYLARSMCQHAAEQGNVTFADIFMEEVFEALAESDPAKLRTELIQSAAVLVAWVEAMDRREP